MALTLMKGSEAIAEAAIRAGARYFFGYPITPQTEIPEYMSARMPEVDGCFLQAESEVAAINMVYGAAGTGARVITSSSSPGISLKQEGISYCAGAMVPAVIINVMRGGPGLGNIQASQGDYFQGVKGGGNGDYHLLTYAPSSIQEFIDIMMFAYEKAEKYRIPVLFLADGIIAQMMEPVDFDKMPERRTNLPEKTWRMASVKEKGYRTMMQLTYGRPLTEFTDRFENETMPLIKKNEVRYEAYGLEDADIVVTAYGTAARMAKAAIKELDTDLKIGFIRPKTAWPFPEEIYSQINPKCKAVFCPEINTIGQMIDDVRIAVAGRFPVYHVGNTKEGPLNTMNIINALNAYVKGE